MQAGSIHEVVDEFSRMKEFDNELLGQLVEDGLCPRTSRLSSFGACEHAQILQLYQWYKYPFHVPAAQNVPADCMCATNGAPGHTTSNKLLISFQFPSFDRRVIR